MTHMHKRERACPTAHAQVLNPPPRLRAAWHDTIQYHSTQGTALNIYIYIYYIYFRPSNPRRQTPPRHYLRVVEEEHQVQKMCEGVHRDITVVA